MVRSKEKYEEEVSKRRKGPTLLYKVGDKILVKDLRQTPLSNRFSGPYIITNVNDDTHTITYRVKNKEHRRHINETKPFDG